MRIRAITSLAFALLYGSFAFANPIAYTFTNASDFTLNGVNYTGPHLGLPPNAPRLTFTLNADTNNVFSSGSFNGSTPGTRYLLNEIGTTTVSYGGATLAALIDSTALVISTFFGGQVSLVDEVNGDILITYLLGFGHGYNGVTDYTGTFLLSGGYPFSPIDTSAGQLVITNGAYQGQFTAAVGSAVPEPSAMVLLATGALGFAGVFRRQLFAE